MQDLIELEEQGWQTLTLVGEASKKFYSAVLHDNAIIVFSGGIRISGKEKILESLATQPWKSFQIEEPQVISLSENVGALVYRVTAQREGSKPYVALISSTYVLNNGTWKLILHQQTLG